jgi:hypothetical protein
METEALLDRLGYRNSPFFLRGEKLFEYPGYSHFFRKACGEPHKVKKSSCSLVGVYALRQRAAHEQHPATIIPTVYVCQAESEQQAAEIHGRVWNQNIVPYLVVNTPRSVRLYSGFEYDRNQPDEEQVLAVARDANEILSRLSPITADSIDSGEVWTKQKISTESRVDRRLLANLYNLAQVLTGQDYKLDLEDAHCLIGKYIYLKYLRDRGILSDSRLAEAKVGESDVFGRRAIREKFFKLEEYLDEFLNGSVFPLPRHGRIRSEHIKKVAGVFKGDDPGTGQQVLFDAYDFSYVPIETLSVVYQQFLHQKGESREKGAYYTPVHLVNFVLDELEVRKPLAEGVKVFDPSCGSGAFLVQCYRRLAEKVLSSEGKLRPTRLRELLLDHIFGLDADEEACRVAQLSLSLTLLDYVDPPDLSSEKHKGFKLPDLRGRNIFHCEGGFFDEDSVWARSIPKHGYNLIVGNPPWKNVKKGQGTEEEKLYDRRAIEWIDRNEKQCPVDNYQLAEAFAWKSKKLLSEDGACGLVMPGMTLFKRQGVPFRRSFFSSVEVWCVVNFANIRRYLFEGAINPAAAFFFSGATNWNREGHYITTYAPFAVEQAGQLSQRAHKKKLWSVLVNYACVKELPLRDVEDGASSPWKIAMWGTSRDRGLVEQLLRQSLTLRGVKNEFDLKIQQGPALRSEASREEVEFVPELVGKDIFDVNAVKGEVRLFSIPGNALSELSSDRCFLRKRTGKKSLLGCRPPHIIVDAAMRFAVYSDKYIVFSPKPFGIAGGEKAKTLLKVITLFLNSNALKYVDIALSASLGIERNRSGEKHVIEAFPMPVGKLLSDSNEVSKWVALHDELVKADAMERKKRVARKEKRLLWTNQDGADTTPYLGVGTMDTLLGEMNEKVYDLMGIGTKQQWLIEDMLSTRMKLNDGVFNAKEAVRPASKREIAEFAHVFQEELDLFLDHAGRGQVHKVKVLYGQRSAVLIVEHLSQAKPTEPEVVAVKDNAVRQELNELQTRLTRKPESQWMYFRRCLRVYDGRRTYVFKPRERLYWLKSQALAEADEFIAEKVSADS